MQRKLRKIPDQKWVGGVAAGVAYWLGMPAWLVRLLWTILVLAYGVGLFFYILLCIFMPTWGPGEPHDFQSVSGG